MLYMQRVAELDRFQGQYFLAAGQSEFVCELPVTRSSRASVSGRNARHTIRYRAWCHFKAYNAHCFLRYCYIKALASEIHLSEGSTVLVGASSTRELSFMHCYNYVKMVKNDRHLHFFRRLFIIVVLLCQRRRLRSRFGNVAQRNVLVIVVFVVIFRCTRQIVQEQAISVALSNELFELFCFF